MPRMDRPLRRMGAPLFPRRRWLRRAAPFAPEPMRQLHQANQLLNSGQFAPAAEKFETLANAARAAGIPRSPRLFFQAARANWNAGSLPHGMELLRTGFETLAAAGAFAVIRQIAGVSIAELTRLGHPQEAEEIRDYAAGLPAIAETGEPQPEAHPLLPTHCSQCGGAVRSDEVEWIDARTAECGYCGSPIRAEAG